MAWNSIIRYTLVFLLFAVNVFASPPSRTYTYTAGSTISPTEVTVNENNIYGYLTAGVDTILDGSVVNADISSSAAIAISKLAETPILYTDTRQAMGSFTRDMTTASGDQVISGLGFTPTKVTFISAVSGGSDNASIGFDNATTHSVIGRFPSGGDGYFAPRTGNDGSIWSSQTATVGYVGYVSAFASGQFTINWTKAGVATGTLSVYYIAER